jgi:hypothetical protein
MMSQSTERPVTREEAAAGFEHERRAAARARDLMAECKHDIEMTIELIDGFASRANRKKRAREFGAAFGIPPEQDGNIEKLFYGDLDVRIEAGRKLWKACHEIQKASE